MTNSIYGTSGPAGSVSAYSAQQSVRKEQSNKAKTVSSVETTEWKPVSEKSSLVPVTKEGYGTVVGDVKLSDKAKEYYAKLKEKFHGMDFILVSTYEAEGENPELILYKKR